VDFKKSLSNKFWKEIKTNQNQIERLSQQKSLSNIFAKLLVARNINEDNLEKFLKPDIVTDVPNPFELKDMKKGVNRCLEALINNQKVGIIADYDVDGSTSASILYKFLKNYSSNIVCKIPNRLSEGYGPNTRIMHEMLKENVELVFTLDCGTSSFNTIDHKDFKKIEVIVIDHHLSEYKLPKVNSIINPNRFDDDSKYKDFAAVGVTFLFLMALRREIREKKLFSQINEPNLIAFLDLVALGTICDIVDIRNYNRAFVKKGLELIIRRKIKVFLV
jgi:Single-stranded DNA-specific exonuclease